MFKGLWIIGVIVLVMYTVITGGIGYLIGYVLDLAIKGDVNVSIFMWIGGAIGFLAGVVYLFAVIKMRQMEKKTIKEFDKFNF